MVDRDSVVWTYRLLLGREPENEQVVDAHCGAPDRAALVRATLESPEFLMRNSIAIKPSGQDVWVEIADSVLLKVNLADELGVSWPVIKGDFETSETAFVKRTVQPGHVCADIGANLGYFTNLMADMVQAFGTILSFEPNPKIFSYLRASVKRNGWLDRVQLYDLALSDRRGGAQLQFAQTTSNWGGSALNFGPQTLAGHVNVDVALETLNHVGRDLSRLDFIKIDVEGAEYLTMTGAADILRRLRPTILSEVHVEQLRRVSNVSGDEYFSLMREYGYDVFELLPGGRLASEPMSRPTRELANVVFLPRERPSP
jgi:FkbM family methyltransferase